MNNEKAVETFAGYMLMYMDKHQKMKGDSWKTCDIEFLEDKLSEEMTEYVFSKCEDKAELIDIANVAMMLWLRKTHELIALQ